MMNLLFSPAGRIGPSAYMKGMLVLGGISALLSLLLLTRSLAVITVAGFASLLLLIPLVMLGIKRSHDAGKTGWMSLAHVAVYFGISFLIGLLFAAIGLSAEPDPALTEGVTDAGEILRITAEAAGDAAIPSAISGFLTFAATAFIVNMLNPHDPTPNQYGNTLDATTFE